MALLGTSSWAGCELQQMEIPVRVVDHRPIATLTLNGTEVPMLVDSGAFYSMLLPSTAEQLNLPMSSLPWGMRIEGYTGRIDAKLTRVDKVGLLTAELRNIEFIVGGNELGAGIMGILGRNILSIADTEYDLAHGAVRLSVPTGDCADINFAHWAGEAPVIVVPLDNRDNRADTAIRVEVNINGKPTRALLDTGAPFTALTLQAARRAGIEASEMTPGSRVGGVGEGMRNSWTARVSQIELGGEKISDNRLRIADVEHTPFGILLGLDYFLSHRIYVSRRKNTMYATWNGGPVFTPDRNATGLYDPQYAALPTDVAKDDADALARRGAASLAAGNPGRALDDLQRACELAPGVAQYPYLRARAHIAARQTLPALTDLDEALRLDPAHTEARFHRAAMRNALGDQPGMQADLAQLDEVLPRSANLRADMGELYARKGQVLSALKQFELWMSTHPKDARLARLLNSRCWMRTRLNLDLPLALQDCKAAVAQDDGEASYRDSLGWTYLRLADAVLAKKAFDDAIKLRPMPISIYGRGLAKARLNDTNGAEADLANARQMKPRIDEEVRTQGFEFVDEVPLPAASEH